MKQFIKEYMMIYSAKGFRRVLIYSNSCCTIVKYLRQFVMKDLFKWARCVECFVLNPNWYPYKMSIFQEFMQATAHTFSQKPLTAYIVMTHAYSYLTEMDLLL